MKSYHHNLGKEGEGNPLYGDAVNNPEKFVGNSRGAGKGDHYRTRPSKLFRKNFDKIDWKK